MLKKEDVLSYYTNADNEIFQMIGYCPYATVIMQNVRTGITEHVVPNCLNAESYIKLVKESKENDTSNR